MPLDRPACLAFSLLVLLLAAPLHAVPPQTLWRLECGDGQTAVYDDALESWVCRDVAGAQVLAIYDANGQKTGKFLGLRDEAFGLFLTLLNLEGHTFVLRLRNPEGIGARAFFGYQDPGALADDPGVYFSGPACDGDVFIERHDVLGMNQGARALDTSQQLATWVPTDLYAQATSVTVGSKLAFDLGLFQMVCEPAGASLDLIPAVRLVQDVGGVFSAPFRLVLQQ